MITPVYIILVIIIYGSILAGLVFFAVKKTRLFMILLGIALILGAVPAGFMAELSISGCCGAPSNNREGLGYVLGVLVAIIGIVLLRLSGRFKKTRLLN